VLCTSRDLPLMLQQELGQFIMADSMPVKSLTLRKGPTPPRPALAEGFSTWRLISQLQMNYLSLMDSENEEGARAQLLGLYANLAETPVARQVEGFATACWSRFTAACLNPARSFSPAGSALP
jgi:type VI secretion system protein ImpG